MQQIILADGPPPLTQEAADAALNVIDFIAAAVRGFDAIDVTNIVRPLWRAHLASWYPYLPLVTRQWYANAPLMLATLNAQWPLLDPLTRSAMSQQWSVELPQMLWMLDPALAEAHAIETQDNVRATLTAAREAASRGSPTAAESEARAIDEISRRRRMTDSLINHGTQMTGLTMDLMKAINRH